MRTWSTISLWLKTLVSAVASTRTGCDRPIALRLVAAVSVLSAGAMVMGSSPDPTNTTIFDRTSIISNEPGVPDHSIYADFENNENVSVHNGNLMISHPSSPSFSLDGGGSFSLSRVYNSQLVRYDDVQKTNQTGPHFIVKHISGQSWVGVGWDIHLGRFSRVVRYKTHPYAALGERRWEYIFDRYQFESSDGTQQSLGPTGTSSEINAHPLLSVQTEAETVCCAGCPASCSACAGKPACSGQLPPVPPGGGVCDECEFNTVTPEYRIVTLENGSKYFLQNLVAEDVSNRGWILNHGRAGWYTTRIEDVFGNAVIVEYWGLGHPYPEAIKAVYSEQDPTMRIDTVLWDKNDPLDRNDADLAAVGGWNDEFHGMLKETHAVGFNGQVIIYKFLYQAVSIQDEIDFTLSPPAGVTRTFAVLARVVLPGSSNTDPRRIDYRYGVTTDVCNPYPFALYVDEKGYPHPKDITLNQVVYPLGGASTYQYSRWVCGNVDQGDSNCSDLITEPPPANPDCKDSAKTALRYCQGVTKRRIFPNGLSTGSTCDASFSEWTWNRAFFTYPNRISVHGCDSYMDYINNANPPLPSGAQPQNRYDSFGPDGLLTRSSFYGNPCVWNAEEGQDLGLSYHLEGWVRDETTFAADRSTVLRKKLYEYDKTGLVLRTREPIAVLEKKATTEFHDTRASCFDPASPISVKTQVSGSAQRDTWNQWRLSWETGDLVRGQRVSHVDYHHKAADNSTPTDTPSCREQANIIGTYKAAFLEEGVLGSRKRYEIYFDFGGDSGFPVCHGKLQQIRSNLDYTIPTAGQDYDPIGNPNSTAYFGTTPSGSARFVTSALVLGTSGNVQDVTYSGGDADVVNGQKAYEVHYGWQNGKAKSMAIGPSGQLGWLSRDFTINTAGQVIASRNPNGPETTFSYDNLGRLKIIDPPGSLEEATRIEYPSLKETRVIRSAGNETEFLSLGDNSQLFSSETYDGLGRVIEKRRVTPGDPNKLAVKLLRYDQYGREVFQSEWILEEELLPSAPNLDMREWAEPARDRDGDGSVDASSFKIKDVPYKNGFPWGTVTYYGTVAGQPTDLNPLLAEPDGLGRVRRILLADGSVTVKEYCGPHEQETITHVRTGISNTADNPPDGRPASDFSDVTTRYYYDGFERLAYVDTEPLATGSGAGGPIGADAAYYYDPRGNLTEARVFPSNRVTGDPFSAWLAGSLPQGQTRSFTFDAIGRLIESQEPERGRVANRRYDVWGNLIAWQDQVGLDRGYYFRSTYDVAGRLLKTEKRKGQITASGYQDEPTDSMKVGPDASEPGTFDSSLSASWVEGRSIAGQATFVPYVFPANTDLAHWQQRAYPFCGISGPPNATTGGAIYFGSSSALPATNCSYSTAWAGDTHLLRVQIPGVSRADELSFSYYRATRQTASSVTTKDRFSVFMTIEDPTSLANKRVVFDQTSAQAVYAKWLRSPSVRPADFASLTEWPEGQTKNIYLFFAFEKGDSSSENLGWGLAVDDLRLGRRGVEPILDQQWDQAICASGSGGAACDSPVEPVDRGKDKLTTVKAYQDGALISTRSFVYRGLNGRLSGVREQIDWTLLAREQTPSDWLEFIQRSAVNNRGVLEQLTAPYAPGIIDPRRYRYLHHADMPVSIIEEGANAHLLQGAGIQYDAAQVPVTIGYANDTILSRPVDALHRVSRITSTRLGATLFDSGNYQYDGGGNIFAIGKQDFVFDKAGRLSEAFMLPQSTAPNSTVRHHVGYGYDPFGNLKSQQLVNAQVSGSPTPPVGFSFTDLLYDSNESTSDGVANRNRIITTGFSYDTNGNSTRFRDQVQNPAGALWDPQNRLRVFVAGDPLSGGSPVESYLYDATAHRVVRVSKRGEPEISIRGEGGHTLAEFKVKAGAAAPSLVNDLVYANDELLIERAASLAPPTLGLYSTLRTGTTYNFQLSTSLGQDSYFVVIQAPSGWRRDLPGVHPDAAGKFGISEGDLSPDETNFVRIRIDGEEASGFSAPVTINRRSTVTTTSANQVRTIVVNRQGTNITVRWELLQTNGKGFKVYFKRDDGVATYALTPQGLPSSTGSLTLSSQALPVACGKFYVDQFQTSTSWNGSPETAPGSPYPSSQGGPGDCDDPPPPSPAPTITFVNAYRHFDHTGNLRLLTGEAGETTPGKIDSYPFGREMSGSSSASDWMYGGHERDTETGLDYVLARYESVGFGRFITVDPGDDIDPKSPQSWNKYAYVRNNPILLTDKDGECAQILWGAVIGGGVEYVSQVAGNLQSGKGWSSLTEVEGNKILFSAAVGAATGGLNLIPGASSLLARAAIAVTGNVAESALHQAVDSPDANYSANIDVRELAADAAIGLLAEGVGEVGGKFAQTTDKAKTLRKEAKKAENIAAKGRPRTAQTNRATAARQTANTYGSGPTAKAATKTLEKTLVAIKNKLATKVEKKKGK